MIRGARPHGPFTAYHVFMVADARSSTEMNICGSKEIFCVPSWYKDQHLADAGVAVYLYFFEDRPIKCPRILLFGGHIFQNLVSDYGS